MLIGLACIRGHRELDGWSFSVWTVPSDWDAPTWFRSASSYTVAALLFALGVVLLGVAVSYTIVRRSAIRGRATIHPP
jgi:hypothetical protein